MNGLRKFRGRKFKFNNKLKSTSPKIGRAGMNLFKMLFKHNWLLHYKPYKFLLLCTAIGSSKAILQYALLSIVFFQAIW